MIPLGLVLLIGSAAMAVSGIAGYLASRRSARRSRSMALTLFGHGALATSGFLTVGMMAHVHSLVVVHVHSISDAFASAFLCDLEWSCVAWIAAAIAVTVLSLSFALSQIVARAIVRRALRNGARRLRVPGHPEVHLLVVPDPTPDAYSVALLHLGGPRGLRARDYILMTTGLLEILTPSERRAVLEHEIAHVRARDDRYLPFFHALASMLFFDPFLRKVRNRLGREYELEADEVSSRKTRDPRSLARALLKLFDATPSSPSGVAASLRGHRQTSAIVQRIERLLALADLMDAGLA